LFNVIYTQDSNSFYVNQKLLPSIDAFIELTSVWGCLLDLLTGVDACVLTAFFMSCWCCQFKNWISPFITLASSYAYLRALSAYFLTYSLCPPCLIVKDIRAALSSSAGVSRPNFWAGWLLLLEAFEGLVYGDIDIGVSIASVFSFLIDEVSTLSYLFLLLNSEGS